MSNICILGSGSMGTALAVSIGEREQNVLMFSRNANVIKSINESRVNSVYLPHVKLPESIRAVPYGFSEINGCDYLFLAVPSRALPNVVIDNRRLIKKADTLVSVVKGFAGDKLPYEFLIETVGKSISQKYVSLLGPSFADLIARRFITVFLASSENIQASKRVCSLFPAHIWCEYSKNVRGNELASILKGAVALIMGYTVGLSLGENFSAFVFSRLIREFARILFTYVGNINIEVLAGLSFLGDSVLTSYSDLSRNRVLGLSLAKSKNTGDCLQILSEGYENIKKIIEVAKRYNIELNVTEAFISAIESSDPTLFIDKIQTLTSL